MTQTINDFKIGQLVSYTRQLSGTKRYTIIDKLSGTFVYGRWAVTAEKAKEVRERRIGWSNSINLEYNTVTIIQTPKHTLIDMKNRR